MITTKKTTNRAVKKTATTRKGSTPKKKSQKRPVKVSRKQQIKEIIEKLKPLLMVLQNPTMTGYKDARDTIARIVFEDSPQEITNIDEHKFVASVMLSVRNLS
ncbi:MAG: hypothetical protein IID16_07145, partial [Candidatus Marinimicrobia bacterium]|nr:hypothetical protein [Candidatus Neomarinimicrobiota bacterium]